MPCSSCENNNFSLNINVKNIAKTITNGVIGIATAITHIDDAEYNLMMTRRLICKECSHAVFNKITRTYHCDICKCCLKLKTQIAGEHCPLKIW